MVNNLNLQVVVDNKTETSEITLEYLNSIETQRRIVPLVYLTILCLLGLPGNMMIIYVYSAQFKRKIRHRTFVIALAVTDFLVCCFSIPFEIGQMTHEYTFYAGWLCKLGRTSNSFFTMSSTFILVALSVNRYRRICQPMQARLTYNQVIGLIVCAWSISALLSWPEMILSGIKIHKLEYNFTGYDCSNEETFADTKYPLAYSTSILIVYILCMCSLIGMCILIGREIIKHVKFDSQFMRSSKAESMNNSKTNGHHKTFHKRGKIFGRNYTFRMKRSKTPTDRHISPTKVTRTALIVSVCFIIVFVPYVLIKLIGALTKGNIMPPSQLAAILLPTLARTHFMNNVVNFIIYICVDSSFRRHCKQFFSVVVNKLLHLSRR